MDALDYAVSAVSVTIINLQDSLRLLMATLMQLEKVEVENKRLRDGLSAIETRWREASQDSCFRRAYRDTMAECAAELAALLAGTNDKELQVEIDKAMEE